MAKELSNDESEKAILAARRSMNHYMTDLGFTEGSAAFNHYVNNALSPIQIYLANKTIGGKQRISNFVSDLQNSVTIEPNSEKLTRCLTGEIAQSIESIIAKAPDNVDLNQRVGGEVFSDIQTKLQNHLMHAGASAAVAALPKERRK